MDISYTSEAGKVISGVYTIEDVRRVYNNSEITYNNYITILRMFNLTEEEIENSINNTNNSEKDDKDEEGKDDDIDVDNIDMDGDE